MTAAPEQAVLAVGADRLIVDLDDPFFSGRKRRQGILVKSHHCRARRMTALWTADINEPLSSGLAALALGSWDVR